MPELEEVENVNVYNIQMKDTIVMVGNKLQLISQSLENIT